jgi:hypothetical protein
LERCTDIDNELHYLVSLSIIFTPAESTEGTIQDFPQQRSGGMLYDIYYHIFLCIKYWILFGKIKDKGKVTVAKITHIHVIP